MANLSRPLTKNFLLGEMLRSATAERDERLKDEQENPPDEVVENLEYLASSTLQPIRDAFGYPIRITSGYRSLLLNKLVGGSATSQHVRGEAADCQLSRLFLTDPDTAPLRREIQERIREVTGRPVQPGQTVKLVTR